MKKITATILLALFSVSIFAQNIRTRENPNFYTQGVPETRNVITFAIGGGGMGTQLFINPKSLKGFGFFMDARFDVYKDLSREDGASEITRVNKYNTWQTDYGSYTTETQTFSEMPYKYVWTVHNIINCGISFPIKENKVIGYAGVGVVRTRYEVENYIQKVIETRIFTHYEALGYNTTDNEIWSFEESLPEEEIIKNSLNLTGGIVWNIEDFGSLTTGLDFNVRENGGIGKPNIVFGIGWYFSKNGLMR